MEIDISAEVSEAIAELERIGGNIPELWVAPTPARHMQQGGVRPPEQVQAEVIKTLDSFGKPSATSGHIFNLGHGVLPKTDPDVLTDLVALVHSL